MNEQSILNKDFENLFKVFLKRFLVLYFSIFVIIVFFLTYYEFQKEKAHVRDNLNTIANNFDNGISSVLRDYEEDTLQSILIGITQNPLISHLKVTNKKNEILFEWHKSQNKKNNYSVELVHELNKTFEAKENFLGTLILSADSFIIFKELDKTFFNIIAINFIAFLIIFLSLIKFGKNYLLIPLISFNNELKDISVKNKMPTLNLDNTKIKEIYDIKENTNILIQEIFVLKDSFQVIVEDLTETQDALIKQNEGLESEIKRRTKEVIEKEKKFRSIFEQSTVGIVIADKRGAIISCNESYVKLLEFDRPRDLLGLSFQSFTHSDDYEEQVKIMKNFLQGKITKGRMEKRYVTKSHKIIWADISATVIKNEHGEIENFIGIVVDITERKKSELELKKLYNLALDANSLTGLPGNNSIRKRIEEALLNKEDLCVIYGDLDYFKAYNDHYGFALGDKLLIHVAKIYAYLGDELKINNFFLGHIGGDDFVIILPHEFVEKYVSLLISDLEESIKGYYNQEDYERGYIKSINRQGETEEFPFVTVSLAALCLKDGKYSTYLEVNDALSFAKKEAKKIIGNSFYLMKE